MKPDGALRIATRRSALARAQAFQVGEALTAATGRPFVLVPMATTGDLHPNRVIAELGTKGVFCDTVRSAVLGGDCDLVVHSYKDTPSEPVGGLTVAAVPRRADPRDVLVTREGHTLATLPPLATVGTSSDRRRLQLLAAKPSLQVLAIRGNIDTRLRRVDEGGLEAVVVALAGLQRLYTAPEHGGLGALGLDLRLAPLEPGECLPAPAQGALALECRAGDNATLAACRLIDDPAAHTSVAAERAFLERLGGGCLAPVGALCATVTRPYHGQGVPEGGAPASARRLTPRRSGVEIELLGLLADPVRRRVVRRSLRGPAHRPEALGRDLADDVAAAGGEEMLAALRGSAPADGSG